MKKPVKIILAAILLLTFCIPSAFAQKIDAPEHVNEIYHSNTGKITVTIDADVIVPDVDRIPIYSAEYRFFDLDELLVMADVAFGDREYFGDTEFNYELLISGKDSTFNEEMYRIHMESVSESGGSSAYNFEAVNGTILDLNVSAAAAEFTMPQVDGETVFFINVFANVRFPDTPPARCQLTYADARKLCDDAVAQFAPVHICVAQAVMMGEVDGDIHDEMIELADEEAWILYYTRELDMPITYNSIGPESNMDLYAPVANDDLIRIVINDDGIQAMDYLTPHKITGVLKEDCELLPFDQIMEVAAAILPLKEVWLEQYYDDVRIDIYEIRLGYMRVISRDTQKFEYIPVWDFFGTEECRETRDGEVRVSQEYPFYSYLTINAIDGTVIDRSYGY